MPQTCIRIKTVEVSLMLLSIQKHQSLSTLSQVHVALPSFAGQHQISPPLSTCACLAHLPQVPNSEHRACFVAWPILQRQKDLTKLFCLYLLHYSIYDNLCLRKNNPFSEELMNSLLFMIKCCFKFKQEKAVGSFKPIFNNEKALNLQWRMQQAKTCCETRCWNKCWLS